MVTDDSTLTTEASAVAAIAPTPQIIKSANGTEFLIIPKTCAQIKLDAARPNPFRHICRVSLRNTLQLLGYLTTNRTDGHRPVIFADKAQRKFTAYLDYHKAAIPSWLDHTATVQMVLSGQAKTWIDKQDFKFSQDAFGDFLEDNDIDLVTQEMHSVAANFQAVRTETFRSSRRKDNGDFELTHNAQTANGGDKIIAVPSAFEIAVPLWEGDEELTKLRLNLRHRVGESGVTFTFKIHQLDRIVDATWLEEVNRLGQSIAANAELYQGAPPTGDAV